MSAPAERPSDQEVQEDLLRLEAYRNQLTNLLQQHQLLSSSRADHDRARETLEGLDGLDAAREIVIPVGADTFVRGHADPRQSVMLGLGSGIVAELDRSRVVEVLHERGSRIDRTTRELEGQIRTLEERVEALSQKLDALSREAASAAGEGGGAGDVRSD